ncbi:hypothetical protein A6A28_16725 [Streptomyces sp. CB03578]|nr:hypothetical protein A6A28_16725 [Streptomyces sp. CB03578]
MQVTVEPSPMRQLMDDTWAVALTVIPPAEAEAVFGPHVVGLGVTHSHMGTPTVYVASGLGLATAGPVKSMLSTACCASTAGSMVTSSGVAAHTVVTTK